MSGGLWTRRRCALLGLSALAGALVSASTRVSAAAGSRRWIELKNLHTGEVLKATFDRDAGPDPETLAKLQHQLRDYRINEEHAMDAALYGLLSDLAEVTGHEARYEVISGYRSPRTNAKLHAEGHGVAEHSLHMEGRAIDVRLPKIDCAALAACALDLARGGVGYYRTSDFVHLDTGRYRTWRG